MSYQIPSDIKIYHIMHLDKLQHVLASGALYSDSKLLQMGNNGTTIGMDSIKRRRLNELELDSHPGLYVGQCVPYYFCPRSVMLYMFYMNNHTEINYRGGQEPIIHLVLDLHEVVKWAKNSQKRWAFTLSNAGSYYFEDRNNLSQLNEINWPVVKSNYWAENRDQKQAEFLIEDECSVSLIEKIGVYSVKYQKKVIQVLGDSSINPVVEVKQNWYY